MGKPSHITSTIGCWDGSVNWWYMLTVNWWKIGFVRLCQQSWKIIFRFKVMKPGFQKVNVVNLRLASSFSILSIFLVYIAGRNLIFCFNFWATQLKKYFSTHPCPSTWQVSIPIANFIFFVAFLFFFCPSKMPKTPKMLMKKHRYWLVDNPRKFKSNTFLFF